MRGSLPVLALLAVQPASRVVMAQPMKVAITGAGGQTAGHVFRKMLARPEAFSPVGITRAESSKKELMESSGATDSQVMVADLAEAAQDPNGPAGKALAAAFFGCAALVIGSSAKVKPTGGVNSETGRPNMGFPDGQPYLVDWLAQKLQIDTARAAGAGHVVICSSMGGTNPDHMLNRFGRTADGRGGGILLWKRKAEKYLIDSGLKYTIVHPGGLLNEPGGRRALVVGVDDRVPTEQRSIPREDVAEVLLQSLVQSDFQNRSFDLVAEPDSGAEVCTEFSKLLEPLQGASCNYELGAIPGADLEKAESALLSAL